MSKRVVRWFKKSLRVGRVTGGEAERAPTLPGLEYQGAIINYIQHAENSNFGANYGEFAGALHRFR